MKRALVAIFGILSALTATAEFASGYYDRMDGKRKETLKAATKECVSSHTRLVYMDLPNYWQYSDVYPELVNGQKRWWEMYSNEIYLIAPYQSAKGSFSANHMQREHSVPKSWWKSGGSVEYTPAYTDMWNLYPSDGAANMAKSNYPLGEVDVATFDNGVTKVGSPKSGTGGGCGNVFEPGDEYKGDFARGFFYMATVYDDLPWVSYYSWMFTTNNYPTLKKWAYEMLLRWSREDPVDQKEILRNDAVEKSQGNRNPFIDFPDLAEYIWGTRSQEVFYLSEQSGIPTPPITGPAELTMPVNGETLDFGQVAIGGGTTSWLVIKGGNLTSPLTVRSGGEDKNCFEVAVRNIPAKDINLTGEYMLSIRFIPTEKRKYEASLNIYDGGLQGSIKVNLTGEGAAVPALTRLVALPAADVTDNSYIARWNAAPEVVDYYVVTRTVYSPDGEDSEEYDSDTNSLMIEGREPSIPESYTVRSSRLGYLSEQSNSIYVDASGVNYINTDDYAFVGPCDGGFRILGNCDVEELRVYDTSGNLIRECRDLNSGEYVELPQGLYIVASCSFKRPYKLIVFGK